jgi:hypothetical protein
MKTVMEAYKRIFTQEHVKNNTSVLVINDPGLGFWIHFYLGTYPILITHLQAEAW